MPSQAHAVLVDLFRSAPSLAIDLLHGTGIDVAHGASPRLLDSTFPVTSPDYHVDLAVALGDGGDTPSLVVLVEVQLDVDPAKLRSWPLYLAAAGARFKCDAFVLVVAIDPRVAAWAATPVPMGPSGSIFRAVVLGPSAVPRLAPGDAARVVPELALLSALCHGGTNPELIGIAVASIAEIAEERAKAYFDLMRYHLGAALERALEAMMGTSEHKYLSDFARKYYGEGEAKGKAEGNVEGELRARPKPSSRSSPPAVSPSPAKRTRDPRVHRLGSPRPVDCPRRDGRERRGPALADVERLRREAPGSPIGSRGRVDLPGRAPLPATHAPRSRSRSRGRGRRSTSMATSTSTRTTISDDDLGVYPAPVAATLESIPDTPPHP